MKRITIWLVLVLVTGFVAAQKKDLSMEEAVVGRWRGLGPENLEGVKWIPNSDEFSHVKDYQRLVKQSAKSGRESDILDLSEMNAALEKLELEKLAYIPYFNYEWMSSELIKFTTGSAIVVLDVNKKEVAYYFDLPDNANNQDFNRVAKNMAFTVDNNLYCAHNKEIITITNDSDKGIVNGDGYVHRQEFGIQEGTFWSPDGNSLAFYRKDETMVTDYPLVDITKRVAGLKNIKYPMAGMKSEEVTVGVYNFDTGNTVFLKTGEPVEQYLTNIAWSPDSKHIFVAVLNRGQDHLKLTKYDAVSGDFVATLFEEKNDRYVEPEHPMIFVPDNSGEFLWYSDRDGYNHLYHYDSNGGLVKQLTKGEWIVTDFLGFDNDNKHIYIMATAESPIERHLYKVALKNGKMTRLTTEPGMHSVKLSSDKSYFIDTYSSQEVPNVVQIKDDKGKIVRQILEAKNPLEAYNMPDIEVGTIKAADGETDLYYRLVTPPEMDKSKKYPAVVYVYGGPHLQQVTNSYLGGVNYWHLLMAQKGYVMLVVDNRGSDNRGFEFESQIHRQLGKIEMADQMEGIKLLENKGFVDMDRIGVHGWSYGGFMTTSLMTNFPEVFKVGVAGGPVIDWRYYEVMYGERYMDTPEENPDGYDNNSLLPMAEKLQGRLLIIHGAADPVVVMQHSLAFVRECVKNRIPLDYFVYPTHEHNVRGMDRIHLMDKVTRYFDDFLK